jgi:hypothetical protein
MADVEEMKAAVKRVHRDAHISDSLGVCVVVGDSCIIGNSGMAYHVDGAEDVAWTDAYEKLPADASPSEPQDACYPGCGGCLDFRYPHLPDCLARGHEEPEAAPTAAGSEEPPPSSSEPT